jgi:SEC-C motif domain protein
MSKRNSSTAGNSACPCGSGLAYSACCEPLHQGQPAANAEALMRSRYSAFALELPDYIQHSWHASTRPSSAIAEAEPARWLGLRIERFETQAEDRATVEFKARYKIGGRAFALHETSRFVREGGHWFYVDGVIHGR